jgi:CRISPR system Cascade subunit CasA
LPVTPEGRPAALAFFACPRRIRLVFEGDEAVGYRTLNYGANYVGWRHPLSPYRQDKAAGLLPVHPHAGASDYGDWPAWWGFNGYPATSLNLWRKRRPEIEPDVERTLVEAFGFDMDNMKARQWLDARLPWVPADEGGLKHAVSPCIGAADAAARALRMAVKLALYGQRKDSGYRLPETLPADSLPEPADRLWRETQADFEALLGRLSDRLRDGDVQTGDLLIGWRDRLRGHAWRIFDETVDLDGLTDQEPRRLLYAREQLGFAFADHAKAAVSAALKLDFALAARTAKRVKEKTP